MSMRMAGRRARRPCLCGDGSLWSTSSGASDAEVILILVGAMWAGPRRWAARTAPRPGSRRGCQAGTCIL